MITVKYCETCKKEVDGACIRVGCRIVHQEKDEQDIPQYTERQLQLTFVCGFMNREEWKENSFVNAVANGELKEKWELFQKQILNNSNEDN
jgi:hypothetical protein